MAKHRVAFEDEVEADSPEDAAIKLRQMLKHGSPSSIFVVDVAGGKVVVDTDEGVEQVIRDDRKCIGPVIMRRMGPTGVMTSPVMARFCEHDKVDSKTDLEFVEGKWLRLRGCGDEAYYEWAGIDGSVSEPFAVITVRRQFAAQDAQTANHNVMGVYAKNAQH